MSFLSTIIKNMLRPVMLNWVSDFILLMPRVVCGYLLAFYFGSVKFGLPWSPVENNLQFFEVAFWFPNDVAEYGGIFKTFSPMLAWLAGFAEAVGGLFLMAGMFTRLFSTLIVVTMLVAVFFQQFNNGLWSMLPALGFMWVSLYTTILGSGRFGVDFLLIKHFEK